MEDTNLHPKVDSLSPQPVEQKPNKKRFFILIIIILILLGISFALIWSSIKKEKPTLKVSSSKEPKVQLKKEYKNPFSKDTQYVNPFSKYKNPFDNLK